MKTTLRKLLLTAFFATGIIGAAEAARLTVAQGFDAQTLWPNGTTNAVTYNVGTPIVESLFWLDPRNNKVTPLLATGYTQETPTSIVVKLRPNVKFTNGEPMNADAVIHSFKILIDPKQTPAYTRYFEAFDKIEKIDDLTVRMTTRFPVPPMDLTLSLFFVVPPAYWNQVGQDEYGRKPIGTGPFKLERWVRDAEVVMKKNETYWGEAPAGFDELVFKPVPDDTARASGLLTGEYDIVKNLPVTSLDDVRKRANVGMLSVGSNAIHSVLMSSLEEHKSPLQDKRVRQAFNYAIDKKSIIDNLLFGHGVPLDGQLLRKTQLGYHPGLKDYPFDPKKAKELLAQAGYPNGFETTLKVPVGSQAQQQEVAEAVAGMLSAIGVKVNVSLIEGGEFLRQLRARELWPMGMSGSSPPDDPHFQMSQYHSTWRYSYIRNAELDKLIDDGKQEMDVEKRAAIYRKASELVYDEAPGIFLYGGVDFWGVSKKVKNFGARGDGRFFFYGVSLER